MSKGFWLFVLLLLSTVVHAAPGKVTYIYSDPNGTPLAEADANGIITATFDYRPYGRQAMGTAPNGPGYTGHVNDPDTGLVYMQARYYDPATGRFLSVDPTGPAPGNTFNFNRYDYANNNPIVNIDPNGKESAGLSLAGVAAIQSNIDQIPPDVARAGLLAEASIILGPIVPEAVAAIKVAISNNSVPSKAQTLANNVARGKAGEAATRAKYGNQIAGEKVSFKTSDGSKAVPDFVTKEGGILETKTGGANLSKGQTKLFNDVNARREVTPVGKNAANAGLEPGKPVVMKSCTIDRC